MGESFYEKTVEIITRWTGCGPTPCQNTDADCACRNIASALANEAQMLANEQVSEVEEMNSNLLGELDELRTALHNTRVEMGRQIQELQYIHDRMMEQTHERYKNKIKRMFDPPDSPRMIAGAGSLYDVR